MKPVDTLEVNFKAKVEELIAKTEAATNRKWAVESGRRTLSEQRNIYAQGRTKPGKVASNAKPGQSAHNFSMAADIYPLKANSEFDYAASDKLFKTMADIAKSLGLTAGFYFKTIHDANHVEDPRWKQEQKDWQDGRLQIT